MHEVTKRAEYSLAGGHAETAYVLLALDGKELSEVSDGHTKEGVKEEGVLLYALGFLHTPFNTPLNTPSNTLNTPFPPFPSLHSLLGK